MLRWVGSWLLVACLIGIQALADESQPNSGPAEHDPSATSQPAAQHGNFTETQLPPAKRIVLYSSGVGHIHHQGRVNGRVRIQVPLSGHDVDDVLKSLVFEDRGGGTITAVEYQPAPEAEDVAANALGNPMTLAQLLQQHRGESLTVVQGTSKLQGIIYGVENRARDQEVQEVLVLMSERGLESVVLSDVDQVRFDNPQVRDQLQLAMTGVVKLRKAGSRPLTLLFDGEGERDVQFAYLIDAPIWRMSYRVTIDQGEVALQGWAHVDNVMGVDWDQVQLDLRSGRPHIYHAELFAPVMVERRSVGLAPFDLPQGLTLVSQWFGFEPPPRFQAGGVSGGGPGGGMGGGMGGGFPSQRTNGDRELDIVSAIRAAGEQEQEEDIVQIKLDAPVSLRSGRSAALPVFAATLPGRLVTLLKFKGDKPETWRALELTNNTPSSLIGGPVHVVLQGQFVGDTSLERVPSQAVASLIYAADRSLETTYETTQPDRVLTELRRQDASLELVYREKFEARLMLRNTQAEERTVLAEFPLPRDGFQISAPAPDRVEHGVAIYSQRVGPGGRSELMLTLAREQSEFVGLIGTASSTWREWLASSARASDELRNLMGALAEQAARIETKRAESARLLTTKNRLLEEQQRARQNLEVLDATSKAAEPFLKRLTETETLIQQTDQAADVVRQQLEELQIQERRLLE